MRWFDVQAAWLVLNTRGGAQTAWVALRLGQNKTHVVPFGITSLHHWFPADSARSVDLRADSSSRLWVVHDDETETEVLDVEVSAQGLCSVAVPHLRISALASSHVLPIRFHAQLSSLDVPLMHKNFEMVVDAETLVPMVLARTKKARVAVSVDGFRLQRVSGAWDIHIKRSDLFCAHLASLCGDSVQRTSFDMGKVKRSSGRQLNLYSGSWWMDESNVPPSFRLAASAPSFSLLVPSDKDENFRYGFCSMINCAIEDSSAAAASSSSAAAGAGGGLSMFDRFLLAAAADKAAKEAKAAMDGEGGEGVAMPVILGVAMPVAAAAAASADGEDGEAAAPKAIVGMPKASVGVAEAAADEAVEGPAKRKRINVDGDANVTSTAQQPFSLRHKSGEEEKEEEEEHHLPLAAGDDKPDPSFGICSAFSAGASGDVSAPIPLMMPRATLWRSPPRSAGGGAGGCAPLSDLMATMAAGAYETSAEAAMGSLHRLRGKVRVDDESENELEEAARPRSRVSVPMVAVAPTRSESFSETLGVSGLMSFAAIGVFGAAAPAEDDDGSHSLSTAAAPSPTLVLARGLESLDLHSDDFGDMPLTEIGPLCMFSFPRFVRSREPEGLHMGTRCSFCWRWAVHRCVECVKGGGVRVVCDACVARVGLEDVTCLACLPVAKTAEGEECVKSRLSLKDAAV